MYDYSGTSEWFLCFESCSDICMSHVLMSPHFLAAKSNCSLQRAGTEMVWYAQEKAPGMLRACSVCRCVRGQTGAACSTTLKSRRSWHVLADWLHLGWLVIARARDPACGQTRVPCCWLYWAMQRLLSAPAVLRSAAWCRCISPAALRRLLCQGVACSVVFPFSPSEEMR